MTIAVDTRWDGVAGIQRYSREVLQRLTVPWHPLGAVGDHLDPRDAFRRVPRDRLIYTPGYNAFVRAERQVLTLHDLIQLHAPWPSRAKYGAYYRAIVRPVVRRTGVVITVSNTSRDAIAEWIGDDSVRVVNASIGASPEFRADVEPAPSSEPFALYVGNLRTHKNVAVVLDALARVSDARLRMLIPQREHAQARGWFETRGLADRVELLPRLSDAQLAAQYRGAAVTLMPSTLEGFGLPALESIMTGTPVLYWRGCAAVAETVGSRGHAVDKATDVDAWADALGSMLRQPTRVTPAQGYDWDQTARAIDTVLRELA